MLPTKDLIAVDFSSHDLKIAQMNISPTRKEILNLATQSIINLSDEDISNAIKQVLKELQIIKSSVVAVIPSFLTITKNIEIPSCDANEIREIINLQASRHTPYSREEIIIDYINIGTFKQNYSKILLVIATRSIIRRQLEVLSRAGLTVQRMAFAPEGISCFLARSLRLGSQDSPIGILHLDEGFTDFMITQKEKMVFIRNIPIGAGHLAAEKEKYEPRFAEEVKKSLEAYTSEDIERTPARFFLIGAIDSFGYLIGVLNSTLNIPTESLSCVNQLPISQNASQICSLNASRLSFLNAIAPLLAYEDTKLDLVPEEIKVEKALQERSREVIKTGILVMAAFVLLYCILLTNIFIKSSFLKKISSRYKLVHNEAQDLEKDFTKNQIIRNLLSARGFSLEVLTEIYKALPLDIQLTYLKFDIEGYFSIEGIAESRTAVFAFVENLKNSPNFKDYFKEVQTPRYISTRQEKEKNLVDFSLACQLDIH